MANKGTDHPMGRKEEAASSNATPSSQPLLTESARTSSVSRRQGTQGEETGEDRLRKTISRAYASALAAYTAARNGVRQASSSEDASQDKQSSPLLLKPIIIPECLSSMMDTEHGRGRTRASNLRPSQHSSRSSVESSHGMPHEKPIKNEGCIFVYNGNYKARQTRSKEAAMMA